MSKPTVAQRRILERMAAGQQIDTSFRRPKFLWADWIPRVTWRGLLRNGWVRGARLTDLGRAALGAATTTPGAEREGQ